MQWNFKKIDSELKRLNWNKSRLAREIGISRQAINQYFNAGVTIYKVKKVADALRLDSKDLLI